MFVGNQIKKHLCVSINIGMKKNKNNLQSNEI